MPRFPEEQAAEKRKAAAITEADRLGHNDKMALEKHETTKVNAINKLDLIDKIIDELRTDLIQDAKPFTQDAQNKVAQLLHDLRAEKGIYEAHVMSITGKRASPPKGLNEFKIELNEAGLKFINKCSTVIANYKPLFAKDIIELDNKLTRFLKRLWNLLIRGINLLPLKTPISFWQPAIAQSKAEAALTTTHKKLSDQTLSDGDSNTPETPESNHSPSSKT